jgi:two-component system, cell cycle sensor histidine kinase and response regulator CckA
LFTLDARGVVLSATRSAENFWLVSPGTLVGRSFMSLVQLTAPPADGSGAEIAWELLRVTALNRAITCKARFADDSTCEILIRLEEVHAQPPQYFAQIDDPARTREPGSPIVIDSGIALLVDNGAVGFFDLNFLAGQVYYSPTWKRMLGYTETDLANTYDSWLRLLHPEDSAAAPDSAGRKQHGGTRSFAVEVRMLHRRGHYVWVNCLGTQVYGPKGALERVTGLQIDISERKELEEQSLLNEERLQRLSNQSQLAVFDLNFASREYWFSTHWTELIGANSLEGDEALQSFVAALPPEVEMRGASAFFLEPSVGQPSFVSALKLHGSNGAELKVLLGAHRQMSRKGELVRVVGFCCKLPAGLASLDETRVPRALVEPILDLLSEAVLAGDAQGNILYMNSRAERIMGISREATRGKKISEIFSLVGRDTGDPDDTALEHALTASEEMRLYGEHALVIAGQEVPLKIVWTAQRVNAADGVAGGVILVFRDPEEMTLTPEELLKVNRFETLGLVAGGISHDFNNLLTTILGGISQAKDNRDYTYLADSERACLAAKALTKQLLAVARGGKAELVQNLGVGDILRDAVRLARAGTNTEVSISVPDTVANIRVDRAQILQVFQNLIINAIQALPERGGKLWLSGMNVQLAEDTMPGVRAGDYVRVEVKDNGCGIASENLEKVFEPFFTTKQQGTGLGLPMVRSIVRKYGGEVVVNSIVGMGTSFQILLPQATNVVDAVAPRLAPSLNFGTGRILLMDDDPDICRLAEGMLASLDYKYDIAKNGEEATALYRRHLNIGRPYSAVILDLTVVGGAGGEETFHQLRGMDKDVRAIVCSGYDSDEMIQHYMDMGFAGYLTKPFRVGDLGRVLKTVLG